MNEQPSDNPRYLDIRQLSAMSRFSVTQIRRFVRAGKIPYFQPGGPGGKLLFPPDALEVREIDDAADRSSDPS
jgi:hypothetical protein